MQGVKSRICLKRRQRCDCGCEFSERAASMAHAAFRLAVKLRKSSVQRWIKKQWIITETILASRSESDPPCAFPTKEPFSSAKRWRSAQSQHTDKARRSLFFRHTRQGMEQLLVVAHVIRFSTAVARRMDAGRAPERVHFQSGIVRESHTAGELGQRTRFFERVFLVGIFVLHSSWELAQIFQRDDLDGKSTESGFDFSALTGVGRSDKKLHEKNQVSPARTIFCAFSKSLIPWPAISVMRSSFFLVNGTCSAVPWTSMNLPEPVITMFMSTSARLSSS